MNKTYYEVLNAKLNKRINELEILYNNAIETISTLQNQLEAIQNTK